MMGKSPSSIVEPDSQNWRALPSPIVKPPFLMNPHLLEEEMRQSLEFCHRHGVRHLEKWSWRGWEDGASGTAHVVVLKLPGSGCSGIKIIKQIKQQRKFQPLGWRGIQLLIHSCPFHSHSKFQNRWTKPFSLWRVSPQWLLPLAAVWPEAKQEQEETLAADIQSSHLSEPFPCFLCW